MKIHSAKEIEEIVAKIRSEIIEDGMNNFVLNFRGQSSDSYKLLSGIGRYGLSRLKIKYRERKLFNLFMKKVENGEFDFIQEPFHKDKFEYIRYWFYFYQAQHLGLKTRLLDWTMRWDIALFFAVNEVEKHGENGQLWIFKCPRNLIINDGNLENIYNQHPLQIKSSYMINSPSYQDKEGKEYISSRRMRRQQGRFFIQPLNLTKTPMELQYQLNPYLTKLTIDGNSKGRILKELEGIDKEWVEYMEDKDVSAEMSKLNNFLNKKCIF